MAYLAIVDPKGDEHRVELDLDSYVLGRDSDATISLPERKVSRKHARLFRENDHYWIEDLGSANGVLVAGRLIDGPEKLLSGAEFAIGGYRMTFVDQAEEAAFGTFTLVGRTPPVKGRSYVLPVGELDVGRGDDNTIVLNHGSISRRHALLNASTNQLVVEDLDSRNGTFVDGTRVGRRELGSGNLVRFGNVEFEVQSSVDKSAERPAERSITTGPQRKALLGLAAGVVVLTIATLAIRMHQQSDDSGAVDESSSAEHTYRQKITDALEKGREMLKQQAWARATKSFNLVMELDPAHPEAGRSRRLALEALDHKRRIQEARNSLERQKHRRVVHLLEPITPEKPYGSPADQIRSKATKQLASSTLNQAGDACRRKEWRTCHNQAAEHLDYAPSSARGMELIQRAENELAKTSAPFVPWLPDPTRKG